MCSETARFDQHNTVYDLLKSTCMYLQCTIIIINSQCHVYMYMPYIP